MIAGLRSLALRLWPVPRLRWLLFGTLLFVAALPGIAALGLRVYENALIRQTEAELTAQSAAIAARTSGASSSGNNAPERKNSGITKKFMISWNPCISFNGDAIAIPRAVNKTATKNITGSAKTTPPQLCG